MTSCEDCENNRCAACGDYSEEARLYREFLARHLPEYDKSDDCNDVFTEEDERQLEAENALQRLLDEEEELERSYVRPVRFVVHATRVTMNPGWGETVTQIPLFYLEGNVTTVDEALEVAKRILIDTQDTYHFFSAYKL